MKLFYVLPLALITLSFCSCSGNGAETENSDSTAVSGPDTTETTAQAATVISQDIDAAQFKSMLDSGNVILVDVRTPEEYAEGHIEGSVNIDYNSADFATSIDTLDKSKTTLVYCFAGKRGGGAREIMAEKGFAEVYNLIGGYGQWPYKQ
ncbi:MAG: rhodanese-like domain-containing protein [Crocinitomicaceae bacterium]|nr:rhodanese-like domain-containing protein [Crocinitomicaceae bacterium]